MLIFETFWDIHTLNLAGSIFSWVCFLAFLSYGGNNPLRKCLFFYTYHGKEHEPIQRVLHWCLFALGGTIVLLLSGYPNVPRFFLMATGDILDTQTSGFFWGDAGLYFFYWLSLDWIHFGIIFTLSSALTPMAIERQSVIGAGYACLSAGLATIGFCCNYYLPDEVQSTFIMDVVDLVQNVLMMMFYIYWLCLNRVRNSFGTFVWYNLIPHVLQFVACATSVLGGHPELEYYLICRFVFRSALLGVFLLYAFHTDAQWFGTATPNVPHPDLLPKAFNEESFPSVCRTLDKYSKLWVHVSELKDSGAEQGGNGVVSKMELREFIFSQSLTVAVKFFKCGTNNNAANDELLQEDVFRINQELKYLQAAQGHENIIKLHGFCLMPPHLTLVTEWCEGKTLDIQLGLSLRYGQLLPLALQCAKAVAWLHKKEILHRDIKLHNFLMQGNTVKLIDFGNACSSKGDLKTYVPGTEGYEAPEVLLEFKAEFKEESKEESKVDRYSEKSDIFALAMVLWHIGACDVHHPMLRPNNHHDVGRSICDNNRPHLGDIKADMPKTYRALVNKCWDQEPSKRPTAPEVVASLTDMVLSRQKGTEAQHPRVPEEWLRDWLRSIAFSHKLEELNRHGFVTKEHVLAMSEESLHKLGFTDGDRDLFAHHLEVKRNNERYVPRLSSSRRVTPVVEPIQLRAFSGNSSSSQQHAPVPPPAQDTATTNVGSELV